MFIKGKEIGKALDYVDKWDMQPEIDWLIEQFLHTKVDTLELLATIDMAMCDLENSGVTPSVDSVKKLIASDKEWKAKLKKTYFSDTDIGWAITECLGLFDSTGR
jgi:type I restriction enzyme S subunit